MDGAKYMIYRQVTKAAFKKALRELGHSPEKFEGQRVPLEKMATLYNLDPEHILNAVEKKELAAHYDYLKDLIWIDALEAAHFYYLKGNV